LSGGRYIGERSWRVNETWAGDPGRTHVRGSSWGRGE
jgi:hypothetical protein